MNLPESCGGSTKPGAVHVVIKLLADSERVICASRRSFVKWIRLGAPRAVSAAMLPRWTINVGTRFIGGRLCFCASSGVFGQMSNLAQAASQWSLACRPAFDGSSRSTSGPFGVRNAPPIWAPES